MTNNIEFPGLGIEMEVNNVAFRLFGLDIYWYAIIIVTGIILAVVFAMTQVKRFGVDGDRLIDVIIIGVITAIIGGRLYYVLFSLEEFHSFKDVINMRAGGIGIYGAIIGAFLGAVIGCKWRKVNLLATADLTSMGFLIGQSIGRWANFVNQEAFGTNTTLPWGMKSQQTERYLRSVQASLAEIGVSVDPSMPVHPTFLYESIWCALGFLLLFLYRKHRKFNGELTLMYFFWYGMGRFFIEGLRTDPLTISASGVRISQLLAIMFMAMALVCWIFCRIYTKGKPLQVPEVAPRQLKVKLKDENGEQTVFITWPANTKEPSKQEKERLAKEQLEKQESADTEEKAEADEESAEVKAGEEEQKEPAEETEVQEEAVEKAEKTAADSESTEETEETDKKE